MKKYLYSSFIVIIAITIMCFSHLSCASSQTMTFEKSTENLNAAKKIFPRHAFVQVRIETIIQYCYPGTNICLTKKFGGLGSGVIVNKFDNITQILTAAHVCKNEVINSSLKILSTTLTVIDINRETYKTEVIAIDSKNDACLLIIKEQILYSPVFVGSFTPEPGDAIYNIAAPAGIAEKNMIPIFQGFYLGNVVNEKTGIIESYYSLPAIGGSSGSMILNYKGELIGILCKAHNKIPVVIGPTFSVIKSFLIENKFTSKPLTIVNN